jgi:hypothetical protein
VYKNNIQFSENKVWKELGFSNRKKSGGDGAVDTPVPIPNTEVKHRSGEGIDRTFRRKNSELLGFFLL